MKLKGFAITTLLLMIASSALWAQGDDCHSHFTGSDRSDFEKGVEAYNNKRYQQCISLMKKVSTKNRTAADPYFYMGVSAVKSGERPAVIKNHFTKLFKYCPNYPNALAYYYMGVVHYTYKQYEEAVVQLDRYFDIANEKPNPEYDVVYEEASTYLYWSEFLAEAEQNQAPFNPVVVSGVSSRSEELMPYLSPDGKEFYYLRQVSADNRRSFYNKELNEKVMRLYVSRWKDTAFNSGEPLPLPFNDGSDMGSPTMTADGNTMYLSVMRHDKGYDNCDIFRSTLKNGVWQTLENVGHNINGERTWDSQPSVTPDGQYLYFASNRSGGLGGTDIWRCRRLPNGDWSRAENLGPAVNTAGNEKCPFIHSDGKTLYFASNGWQGFGGYDMYFIDITDTYLKRPTNLGLPINTEGDDICLGVSTDGKHGYFAGKSTEWVGVGGNDIFRFELYPAAQPEEMTIVEGGKIKSTDGKPLSGTISVLRKKTDSDVYYFSSEQDRYAIAISAKGESTVIVNSDGYLPRVVSGNSLQIKRDMQSADFALNEAKLLGRYPLHLSKKGKNLLPLDSYSTAVLDAYTDFLLKYPRMHIRIEATTMELAKTIYDYLLSRQLRPERLEYKPNSSLSSPVIVITEM